MVTPDRIGNERKAEASEPGAFVFRIGPAELDELRRELRVAGHPVPVEAKAFDVLAALARRPGETLTKDELFDLVWPGRVVTEGVLAKAVMRLRALLGDSDQSLIKTVHGYGYRLVAPVQRLQAREAPAWEPRHGDPVPHRAHWRLERSLGEGGSALVWLARHEKTGEVRVFKYARDGAMLAALKREVTLYRLLHDTLGDTAPVVRILDWNIDEPPYHTESEFVPGGNLAEWMAAQPATTLEQRIDWLAQTAEAVAAAHRVGVLHKDLKPGNVLVNNSGAAPRIVLCDFGIGALLEPQRLAELGITRQGFTRTRGGDDDTSGTPAYLAPELLAGSAPTTASDVFALGVMLFQLVVGDLARPLGAGWERDVADALLREDIAAAADTDPARRLVSAAELALRLRTLPQRRSQRQAQQQRERDAARLKEAASRSQVRRRWLAALMVALAAGLAASAWLYRRAEDEATVARAVNAFLTEDLIAATNPYNAQGHDPTMREVLDRARAQLDDRFRDRPREEVAVRVALGSSYRGIGDQTAAREEFQRARELVAATEGDDSEAALHLRFELGAVAVDDSRLDDAERLYRELEAPVRRQFGSDSREALDLQGRLAHLTGARGDTEAGIAAMRLVLARERVLLPPDDALLAETLFDLGRALSDAAQYAEARATLEEARSIRVHRFGEDAPSVQVILQSLALVERAEGKPEAALAIQQRVLAAREQLLGRTHPATLNALNEVASLLQDLKRLPEAEALFREVLAARERTLGDRHASTRNSLNNLGLVLSLQGELDEAEGYYQRALAVERELLGSDHLDVLILVHNLAGLQRKRGLLTQAEALHRDAVTRAQAALGPDRPEPGLFRVGLAQTLQAQKRYDEAQAEFTAARATLMRAYGPEHPRITRIDEMVAAMAAERAQLP